MNYRSNFMLSVFTLTMKNFKLLYFTLFLMCNTFLSLAQFPGMGSGGGGMKGEMPKIAKLYGKVVDAKTKKPVEFAAVALLWFDKDSAVAGVLAKANGDFSLDNLPFGGFRLRISFIGYKTYEQKMFINMQSMDKDLGNINLEPDESLLKEVTISDEKSTINLSIDRKIYNVDKDLSTRGGTGLDAVKNIPSVSVDAEGNVTLRNNGVQIFVDGRPTTLTLNQLPSDQIDRIEVITNPSVKFDASATGGILNVILKKNTKPGYNGVIMGGAGNTDRYNGMVNLNIKENAMNFFVMYNYMTGTNYNNGYTNRDNISQPLPIKYFDQSNITRMTNTFQFGRIGFDYNLNIRNSITVSAMYMNGAHVSYDRQKYSSLDDSKNELFFGERNNDQKTNWRNCMAQLLYKKTFIKPGKELTADINVNNSGSKGGYTFQTFDYLPGGVASPLNPLTQINTTNSRADMYNAQIDYVDPINETSKLEWGLRSNIKNSRSKNLTDNYIQSSETFVQDTALTNDYKIEDMVNAAYVNYSSKAFGIGYQAGLRFEQSYYKGTILNKNDSSFSYQYPTGIDNLLNALFPAIYFSKKFAGSHEVQLNFSRKINRPNFFQLMPFVMFADKYNIRIGNPALTPEFINIAEMNYNWTYGKTNFLTSLYGRQTENPITNIAYPTVEDPNVIVNTFQNGKNSLSYGWENTFKTTLFKSLDVTASLNTFYLNINYTDNNNLTIQNEGYSYNAKLILAYRFPKDWTLQTNGNYEAPKILPQGTTLPMYFMDISLNKMLNRKFIFNLTVSDVFNSKRMGSYYSTPDYIQDLSRRRENRFVRLSVTWLFGKMDSSIFKTAKRMKKEGGSMNMGSQDGLDF
jgi:hypothetical protein